MSTTDSVELKDVKIQTESHVNDDSDKKPEANSVPQSSTIAPGQPQTETSEPGCVDKLFPQRDEGIFFGVRLFSHSLKPRKLTRFEKLITVGQVVVSIVTTIMSILSFSGLYSTTVLLTDFARNMATVPVSDITIVAQDLCPSPYVDLATLLVPYAPTAETRTTYPVRKWRDAKICIARDPDHGTALERIRPGPNGDCPTGYQRCGPQVCTRAATCPVAGYTIATTGSSGDWTFDGQDYTLTVRYVDDTNPYPLTEIVYNLESRVCPGMAGGNTPESCDSEPMDTRWVHNDQYELRLAVPESIRPYVSETASIYAFTRNEIYWDEANCPQTRDEAFHMIPPLREIPNTQLVMLVISAIGTLVNLYYARKVYKERTDDIEFNDNNSEAFLTMTSLAVNVVTLGTSIYAYSKARIVQDFVTSVANSPDCTDPMTLAVFANTKSSVHDSTGFNLVVLVLRGLWLGYNMIDYFVFTKRVQTISVQASGHTRRISQGTASP